MFRNKDKNMENNEMKTTTVSTELSAEQFAFLDEWRKTHERELGIEVPIGSMLRKIVDNAMKNHQRKEEKTARGDAGAERHERPGKPFGERPARPFGDKPRGGGFGGGERKPFGGARKPFGDKKPFGDRKPFGDKAPRKSVGDVARKPYGDKHKKTFSK